MCAGTATTLSVHTSNADTQARGNPRVAAAAAAAARAGGREAAAPILLLLRARVRVRARLVGQKQMSRVEARVAVVLGSTVLLIVLGMPLAMWLLDTAYLL